MGGGADDEPDSTDLMNSAGAFATEVEGDLANLEGGGKPKRTVIQKNFHKGLDLLAHGGGQEQDSDDEKDRGTHNIKITKN